MRVTQFAWITAFATAVAVVIFALPQPEPLVTEAAVSRATPPRASYSGTAAGRSPTRARTRRESSVAPPVAPCSIATRTSTPRAANRNFAPALWKTSP